jgi:periplasmic divalent cation tolerance protein
MTALVVMTTLPDSPAAVKLAQALVENHSAACVHILPAGQSIYRWKGRIETASECTLIIKCTEAVYPLLERDILQHHPYELPEILALPVVRGLEAYLGWVAEQTA